MLIICLCRILNLIYANIYKLKLKILQFILLIYCKGVCISAIILIITVKITKEIWQKLIKQRGNKDELQNSAIWSEYIAYT